MKKIFYIFLLTFISTSVYSQPSATWQKLYDDPLHKSEFGYGFAFADSNNFYVAGYMINPLHPYILKIQLNSDTIWKRTITQYGYLIYAACKTSDNSCLLTGDGTAIMKINTQGNLIWWQNYGGYNAHTYDIKSVSNDRYISCGTNNGVSSGHILMIDTLGNLIWQKDYSTNSDKIFYTIDEIPGKGFIAAGLDNHSDTTWVELINIDYEGNKNWEKYYKLFEDNSGANKVIYTNGFIFLGGSYGHDSLNQPISNMFLAKLDTSGNLLSEKSIPTIQGTEVFSTMAMVNSNKFIMTSYDDHRFSDTTNYARLFIIDTMGNIKKERVIHSIYNGYNHLRRIQPLQNGNILFVGDARYINTYPTGQGPDDIWVVQSDSDLNFPAEFIEVKNEGYLIPKAFQLQQNYPNPFNPVTKIKFSIPGNVSQNIKIVVYDILGKEVNIPMNKNLKAGTYEITFNAFYLSSGIYFYSLLVDNEIIISKKMVLLK